VQVFATGSGAVHVSETAFVRFRTTGARNGTGFARQGRDVVFLTESAIMDIVRPEQVLTLVLFLGALCLVWLWVKTNRGGLARKISGDRRMRLVEVAALSPMDRAMILSVDGREFLILRCKGEAPLMRALPAGETPVAEDAA
jgi:flagellar protein FliO/FliZ